VIVYVVHANCDKDSKRKARDLARSIKEEDSRRLLEEENAEDDLILTPGNLTMVERRTIPLNVDTADDANDQFIPQLYENSDGQNGLTFKGYSPKGSPKH